VLPLSPVIALFKKSRAPTEAHNIRFAQPRAVGRKVSDEYAVPVCRLHHRDLRSYGDEASWWAWGRHRSPADRARTLAAIALERTLVELQPCDPYVGTRIRTRHRLAVSRVAESRKQTD
jgi:hypothetical protein